MRQLRTQVVIHIKTQRVNDQHNQEPKNNIKFLYVLNLEIGLDIRV
jgi:hypothetical protein